ncbi:DUF2759 domain-containing protein [Caldibacillus thermolactis]|jgi:hypothetical protein|uniref:DUF2759 domain-containing protein n=1 Tax=Pallidibacillus thermolactis TaxID=251051 RepID=A0ABT2WMD0_9BACI|nr:DUF2759 domain-containing protein [Pallidibacillus thermolactis]MCU9595142.1 DUF2759 domain-containing protein [Pallidibacillus thermolactis]MCU9600354.1 DUF2759 domain-containing protein [Pallidibacillus thermolactis subsp. kokeshiiformis]MED1674419.1 DUF2759 domain-containing protein [Pallidibacillus thermolactis subsp. kokeshiiformis]
MGTVIITGLITILAIIATYSCYKNKNYLGLFFAVATVAVFGFFTVATILFNGYPDLS